MDRESKVKFWLILAAVFALIAICGVAGKYVSEFSTYALHDQEKWGQFGDYFGGILNPILSFFAFIALLVTLRIQFVANEDGERRHNEQLREQRLFQLIGLMNQNAINASLLVVRYLHPRSNSDRYAHGHQALHHAAEHLRDGLESCVRISAQAHENDMAVFESAKGRFQEWRKDNWPAIGLYIDSVFLVLDFALKDNASDSFKKFAIHTLRVQLSESERLLIWYSAMFTAEYTIYLTPLLGSGFVDDYNGTLEDKIKTWREMMIKCSFSWAKVEIQRRSVQ